MGSGLFYHKKNRHLFHTERMDVLCTDKTGTLTMDKIILEKDCDVDLKEDDGVLALAYMNSHFPTGLKNIRDRATLAHIETHACTSIPDYAKVDEIPFRWSAMLSSHNW